MLSSELPGYPACFCRWREDADLDILLTSELYVYPVCFLCMREDVDLDRVVALVMLLLLAENMSIGFGLACQALGQ